MTIEIGPLEGRWVTIDGEEYLRFGPRNWYCSYGMSLETVHHDDECEKLEAAYVAATK